jgi:hypothetical protein
MSCKLKKKLSTEEEEGFNARQAQPKKTKFRVFLIFFFKTPEHRGGGGLQRTTGAQQALRNAAPSTLPHQLRQPSTAVVKSVVKQAPSKRCEMQRR